MTFLDHTGIVHTRDAIEASPELKPHILNVRGSNMFSKGYRKTYKNRSKFDSRSWAHGSREAFKRFERCLNEHKEREGEHTFEHMEHLGTCVGSLFALVFGPLTTNEGLPSEKVITETMFDLDGVAKKLNKKNIDTRKIGRAMHERIVDNNSKTAYGIKERFCEIFMQ